MNLRREAFARVMSRFLVHNFRARRFKVMGSLVRVFGAPRSNFQ